MKNDTLEPQGIVDRINANRMKPATYNEKDLINFNRPLRWMSTVEKHGNIDNAGFYIFGAFCILAIGYFATRSLW